MTSRPSPDRREEAFACPHCGADVPAGQRACPACGSDEETGWAEDAESADLPSGYSPDDDFDYQAFAAREFGAPRCRRPAARLKSILLVAAIVTLIALFLLTMIR